jgi:integrase
MSVQKNGSGIIIRFAINKQLYRMGKLGQWDNPIDHTKAENIQAQIDFDIRQGNFDCLDNEQLYQRYHSMARLTSSLLEAKNRLDALDLAIAHLKIKSSVSLKCAIALIRKYGKTIKSSQDMQKFTDWAVSGDRTTQSVNRYINELRPLMPHLFEGIQKPKNQKARQEKPFTKEEVNKICDWFLGSQSYGHYYKFIRFLFLTGVRTSEAVALQRKRVDFDKKLITISDSVAKDTNNVRSRKATKTGVDRYIPMSGHLLEILNDARFLLPDELVFPAPKGGFIDPSNFRDRAWTKCLTKLGIEYRSLYNTRHTFISHYLETTKDFMKCAMLTHGSATGVATLQKHYAHLVNQVEMPDLY